MGRRLAKALPYAPIQTDLRVRPEFRALVTELGKKHGRGMAVQVYACLWIYACSTDPRPDGLFDEPTDIELKDICDWRGKSSVLRHALISSGVVQQAAQAKWRLACWELDAAELLHGRRVAAERARVLPLRESILQRDGNLCRYCGCVPERVHIDHVRPISRGGKSTMENLVVACAPCNLAKGAKEVL